MAGMKSGISLTVIWNIIGLSLEYCWMFSGISLTGAWNFPGWNLEYRWLESGITGGMDLEDWDGWDEVGNILDCYLEYHWLESGILLDVFWNLLDWSLE